jgi:L-2-hydroxyglutarate oxidase LhgO
MPDSCFDIAIIGGGIIGLSTAMHLTRALPRLRVVVLEKENQVARHQSGHNSGVIHSGIYYKPGSLKARMCVEGAAGMVAFCHEHNIPYRVCGKLIIATSESEGFRLDALFARGQANGITGLRVLGRDQLREREPHCGGIRGLHILGTGITDYAAVCRKYADIFVLHGGTLRTNARVTAFVNKAGETLIETTAGEFPARFVINCAGLHSDRIARAFGQEPGVEIVPFRGEYYDLVSEKQHLVHALIYPVPDPQFPFLGVHFTRNIHGGVHAGPNAVLALKREGYGRTDLSPRDAIETLTYPGFWRMARKHWRDGAREVCRSFSKRLFVRELKKLVPEIAIADLVKDGSGVRAQALQRDGSLLDDFTFVHSENVLHVWNVPSPAATASLSIGRAILEMARKAFDLKQ